MREGFVSLNIGPHRRSFTNSNPAGCVARSFGASDPLARRTPFTNLAPGRASFSRRALAWSGGV
jgi:hypothetical protein